jgi:hypothetical protein
LAKISKDGVAASPKPLAISNPLKIKSFTFSCVLPIGRTSGFKKTLKFSIIPLWPRRRPITDKCYKKNWAIKGDKNTSFFHQAIIKRARRNTITHLQNPDGSFSTTHEQLAHTANEYFTSIFRTLISNNVGNEM